MSNKLDELVSKRQIIQMLIDDGELKGFETLPKDTSKTDRCGCCYCSDCKYHHDDCVCVHNEYLKQILNLSSKGLK